MRALLLSLPLVLASGREGGDLGDLEHILDKLFFGSDQPSALAASQAVEQAAPKYSDAEMGDFGLVQRKIITERVCDEPLAVLQAAAGTQSTIVPHRPINLTTEGDEHSLKANQRIFPGQVFLTVGIDNMLVSTEPHPDLEPILWNVNNSEVQHTLWMKQQPFNTVWLAINLLYHKALGSQSKFAPYINMLPETLNLPTNWAADEVTELEGTSLDGRMLTFERIMVREWHKVLFPTLFSVTPRATLVFKGKESFFTLEQFRWAFDIIETRAFSVKHRGYKSKALVPLVDMANHNADQRHTDALWDYADGKLIVASRGKFEVGDEVTMNYGSLNNAGLLMHYGFTIANNPVKGTPRPPDLWPTSAADVEDILSKFKTTKEEDEKLLQQTDLPINALHALRVRMEERDALTGMDFHRTLKSDSASSYRQI